MRADIQSRRKMGLRCITFAPSCALAPCDAQLVVGLGRVYLLRNVDFPAAEKEFEGSVATDGNNLVYPQGPRLDLIIFP